jgi:hypothetical protein
MLSPLDRDPSRRPGRRPPASLRQEYQQFLLERIEEYKNALSRAELLSIGDEAVRELEANAAGQYLLTEVLLLEHVDRVIARRLKLPTFRRWTQTHRALRQAQREPTHWGLGTKHPLVPWASRLEAGDVIVVVGGAAQPEAMFLAAHDVDVFLVDQELHAVESAEQRAVTEQLGARVHALVIQFGSWFPDVSPRLAVIDSSALTAAKSRDRNALVKDLQARTRPGGAHVILGGAGSVQVISLAARSLHGSYVQAGWQVEPALGKRSGALVATKPVRQVDTATNVSQ